MEEKILALQERKREMARNALGDGSGMGVSSRTATKAPDLSLEDLRFLLGVMDGE